MPELSIEDTAGQEEDKPRNGCPKSNEKTVGLPVRGRVVAERLVLPNYPHF